MSRFWAYSSTPVEVGQTALAGDEARHLAARRLRVGDQFVLFDGRGGIGEAVVDRLGKREALVSVEEVRHEERRQSGFVLASAIPKGDRLSTLLQMLTQLGVETWQPLVLDESAVRKLDPNAPRLQRILVEGAKVARRAWTLDVEPPRSLDELLALQPVDASAKPGLIVYGDREGARTSLSEDTRLFVIGPEAGLSHAEQTRLRHAGGSPISLAPDNLRIETAAVAAATAYQLRMGENERTKFAISNGDTNR